MNSTYVSRLKLFALVFGLGVLSQMGQLQAISATQSCTIVGGQGTATLYLSYDKSNCSGTQTITVSYISNSPITSIGVALVEENAEELECEAQFPGSTCTVNQQNVVIFSFNSFPATTVPIVVGTIQVNFNLPGCCDSISQPFAFNLNQNPELVCFSSLSFNCPCNPYVAQLINKYCSAFSRTKASAVIS